MRDSVGEAARPAREAAAYAGRIHRELAELAQELDPEQRRKLEMRMEELTSSQIGDFTVHVRPELVVEIAFDDIQSSTRYPAGLALRFARVKGYRPDKRAEDADTIDTVRALYDGRRTG